VTLGVAVLAAGCVERMRRYDMRTNGFPVDLSTAFLRCRPGRVVQTSGASASIGARYLVFACGQVASYSCDPIGSNPPPVCTLETVRRSHFEDLERAIGQRARAAAARAAVVDALQWTPAQLRGEADRLFWRGRDLEKRGRYIEACEAFARSDDLVRTFGTAVNLGDCAARGGAAERAAGFYEAAASLADRSGMPEQAQQARELARRARELAP